MAALDEVAGQRVGVAPSIPVPKGTPFVLQGGANELRRRLQWLTLARLGVATVLLTIVLAFGRTATGGTPTARGVQAVVFVLFGISLVYAFALARGGNLRRLAIVQIALDLAAWTALVYVTGGPTSPLGFFFGLSALTAALVLGAGAARVTAVVGIAIYGALIIAMTSGVLAPLRDDVRRAEASPHELAFQLVSNVLGVLFVSALGGNLAARLSRTGGLLARAEASRAALAALHEDVLRSIPVALLTVSDDGTISGANPVAAELLDVPVDALLGSPVSRFLPFVPRDAFGANSAPLDGDETLESPHRSLRIAYRTAPLYDREGAARGGLVVIEDRSHAESLREAMQRAERLAGLGRLAAALAHEIRNPLGAISGGVELVSDASALGAEDRALLQTVLGEVARLNALVTDMLSFARPRPPELTSVDLVALAGDVVRLSGSEQTRVRFALTSPDAPVNVQADPAQIRQVVWNLVRNAAQASPDGSTIDVCVANSDHRVELRVCDRGAGVPAEARSRIFDAFYSDKTRGTGLGLAIVKQIADAHGIPVEVRAREGGGSVFALTWQVG